MSANDFLQETAKALGVEARRQRRARALLVVGLVIIAGLLSGLAVVIYVNVQQQHAINDMKGDIRRFCEDGVIDCRGHNGLPGARGPVGTGLEDVKCIDGRFVVYFTNGQVDRVGDCVAQNGKRGPRGPRGYHGARGPRGPRGLQGRTGKAGHSAPAPSHGHGHHH